MTKLALTLAFLASSYAQAATVIARYDYGAGFSIKPGSEYFEVYDNGAVQFHSEYYNRQTGKDEIRDLKLAKLNLTQVKAMLPEIASFKATDLIDEKEGQPQCTDSPTSEFSVYQNGQQVVIQREAGCHTWQNPNAVLVVAVLKGLAALAKF